MPSPPMQVRDVLEATHRLGGANYVLWGGREGYETLQNTDLKREMDNFGRFLAMVVEHKHKIGFTGTILIEPKPHEPTKHQYDFDTATVYGFLKRYGLGATRCASTSRRTTRRSPGTPSSMRSPWPARSASSARSTPIAATIRMAGTPTSSQQRRGDDAGACSK